MLTWNQVRAHIRHTHETTEETEGRLRLRCELPDGELQHLQVNLRDSSRRGPTIEILAPIGDLTQVSAGDALSYNQSAEIGALVLGGETLLLRAILVPRDVTLALVDETIAQVAREAARLRRLTTRVAVPAELFSYLA
jgi:hypothetical protein